MNIKVFRTALIVLSSILSATVTAFAGPISFVGIAVPFLIRHCLNTSKPLVVIPATFLGGGVFCMLCDLIARTAFAPTELNISTVTSIFGAPGRYLHDAAPEGRTEMTDTPYFVIDDLTIGYHKVPVIRDISVKVQKGEIIALIGPNGSRQIPRCSRPSRVTWNRSGGRSFSRDGICRRSPTASSPKSSP